MKQCGDMTRNMLFASSAIIIITSALAIYSFLWNIIIALSHSRLTNQHWLGLRITFQLNHSWVPPFLSLWLIIEKITKILTRNQEKITRKRMNKNKARDDDKKQKKCDVRFLHLRLFLTELSRTGNKINGRIISSSFSFRRFFEDNFCSNLGDK